MATSTKFNMNVMKAQKTRTFSSLSDRASKVPKASDCVVEEGPRPQRAAKRLPNHAPVVVCLYKFTDEASDVWNAYEGVAGIKLWQVQMHHEARPSILFGIVDEFNLLLRKSHAKDENIPSSLADLQQRAGIKLTLTDRSDPHEVGFIQWRVAFYVAGKSDEALKNFLFLLDDFFQMKRDAMARETPFEVVFHPHQGLDIADLEGNLAYEHYIFHKHALTLPLAIFEAQPIAGKRIVCLHLQPESPTTISILITGNTWNFKGRLDSFGIAGAYVSDDGNDNNRKYYRIGTDFQHIIHFFFCTDKFPVVLIERIVIGACGS